MQYTSGVIAMRQENKGPKEGTLMPPDIFTKG